MTPFLQVVAPRLVTTPRRVRERGFEVQGIVGGVFMGAVRPGFADEQARGVIVAPRSDVPVRASRGVGGDVARVLPERGEAYHPVRLVVAEEQGLGPRSHCAVLRPGGRSRSRSCCPRALVTTAGWSNQGP